MKKLIIAAAIVGFAAVTNAATFLWTTDAQAYGPSVANLTTDTSGVYGCGTANADRMRAETSNQGVTWTFLMLLSDGTNNEQIEGTVSTYSSNKISQNITTTYIDVPTGEGSATISWEIVITGTKSTEAGTYTYVSDTITGSAVYTALSNPDINTHAPSSWDITAPVPEPTSGLLVVLGLAGLALRRRRA